MFESWATFLILGIFALGFVLERIFAARPLPQVAGWHWRASILFFVTLVVNAVVPMLIAQLVGQLTNLRLARLGTLGGGVLAFVVLDFGQYWLHRAQHRLSWLWRFTHQLHHSAERVDVIGASFFHPLDIALWAAVSSIMAGLLGVTGEAAALAGIVGGILAVLQHLNVRTPRWLGYIVQRPEGHSLHHARGVHAHNYGGLALWDLLFGTFDNPVDFNRISGFYDGASARIFDMLIGRDVSEPLTDAVAGAKVTDQSRSRSL